MPTSFAHPDVFTDRHLGVHSTDLEAMLRAVEVASLDELVAQTVPAGIRLNTALHLPEALSEREMVALLQQLAAQNTVAKSYIGAGYYNTHLPTVIKRNVLENPGWYTQYTPYQAEIAQGRLEALLNFQTMICDLTGMEIANASLLDESTAAAEAMTMAHGLVAKGKLGDRILVDELCHPQTVALLNTRAEPVGIGVDVQDLTTATLTPEHYAVLIQYPATDGSIRQHRELIAAAKAQGSVVIFATDLLALTLLTPPGELGADIVVGSAQRFGVPMGYGGPHAAFFATSDAHKRNIPGRIVGRSIDADEQPALRLALQTREQHIRREKATSNICTAQVLLAIINSMYAVFHGPERLAAIATRTHRMAQVLAAGLKDLGLHVQDVPYFDTLHIDLVDNVAEKVHHLRRTTEAAHINLRYFPDGSVGISVDETTTVKDIEQLLLLFAELVGKRDTDVRMDRYTQVQLFDWPTDIRRMSKYLTHPVFNSYHTETDMMRYIKSLENKDLSLTFSMIPLGSCTMKLNAATELQALSMSGFMDIHPFAPAEQARGYAQMHTELSHYLCEVTGFAAVSLMPNSGAQGEYAGLLAIRNYLRSKGESHRNIALIPASAHGTNPASAVMAGMKVVVSKTD
jgi:glycine dehydrogenase